MSRAFGIDLAWRPGFELHADEVPAELRGPEVRSLALRIAAGLGGGAARLDAAVIGRAARQLVGDPTGVAGEAEPAVTLQHLKQLWHVLVAHGRPRA